MRKNLWLVMFILTASGWWHNLAAQPVGSIQQYYYRADNTTTFAPIVSYKYDSNWYIEGRYNYEDLNTFSMYLGKTFEKNAAVSYSITPTAGAVFGAFNGGSVGANISLEYKRLYFSTQPQYTVSVNTHESNFMYSWSDLSLGVTNWLSLGVSLQHTKNYQTKGIPEKGFFAELSLKKWSLPVYVFSPGSKELYFLVGVNFEWEGKKPKKASEPMPAVPKDSTVNLLAKASKKAAAENAAKTDAKYAADKSGIAYAGNARNTESTGNQSSETPGNGGAGSERNYSANAANTSLKSSGNAIANGQAGSLIHKTSIAYTADTAEKPVKRSKGSGAEEVSEGAAGTGTAGSVSGLLAQVSTAAVSEAIKAPGAAGQINNQRQTVSKNKEISTGLMNEANVLAAGGSAVSKNITSGSKDGIIITARNAEKGSILNNAAETGAVNTAAAEHTAFLTVQDENRYFAIVFGPFKDKDIAAAIQLRLDGRNGKSTVLFAEGTDFKVRMGGFADKKDAEKILDHIKAAGENEQSEIVPYLLKNVNLFEKK